MTDTPRLAATRAFDDGGYRYLPGVFQYSAGVVAQPGFAIERACLWSALPLADGFAAIEAFLRARGRPTTALCACELRSPEPLTDAGFAQFNRTYVDALERWGLYRDGVNPVARTNVCPVFDAPPAPALLAFAYTMPAASDVPGTFVVAGGGEAKDGGARYRDSIVRYQDVSPAGLRDKVRYVVGEMARRLDALGFSWPPASSTQVYTVHDIGALVRDELLARGAGRAGLTWHFCRPPVIDIEFEMDVRRPWLEHLLRP
jgi:hypothetical protein